MPLPNWRQNLRRRGGFWRDGHWYDLHLERRMPLVPEMYDEMVAALPPLPPDAAVCDLACGTGNAAYVVLAAYPIGRLALLDQDRELLALASAKVADFAPAVDAFPVTLGADGEPLPGGPYDLVVAGLALHAVVGHDVEGAEADTHYELLFQSIRGALAPGGHLIVGDHVGTLGLYRQMKAMERAGFTDVDCAWRQDAFFVCGGRVTE